MAFYRHVRDKQDLINAMTEVVLEGIDVTDGFGLEMTWTDRIRLAIDNYKGQLDARPLALPLSIAYNGEGPPSFWRVLEQLLAILLDAGFARGVAIVLIRMISNLLAGYLMLLQQGAHEDGFRLLDAKQIDLLRRRFALVQLNLPRDESPNLVESAEDTAEVSLTDPNAWNSGRYGGLGFGMWTPSTGLDSPNCQVSTKPGQVHLRTIRGPGSTSNRALEGPRRRHRLLHGLGRRSAHRRSHLRHGGHRRRHHRGHRDRPPPIP
jgi:AcrR family transcriptional regulator